jgi:type IV secretion system protein VirB4
LIKSDLAPGSRQFLIKKGHDCVVCTLDLSGLDQELAVLSGRAASLRRMERLINELGESPDAWLQAFWGGDATGTSSARTSVHPPI